MINDKIFLLTKFDLGNKSNCLIFNSAFLWVGSTTLRKPYNSRNSIFLLLVECKILLHQKDVAVIVQTDSP